MAAFLASFFRSASSLVQGQLQLGAQIVGDLPLLAVFVGNVQGGEDRAVGDGEGGAGHGLVQLVFDDLRALLDIALVLLGQDVVVLVVDADGHPVCHICFLLRGYFL